MATMLMMRRHEKDFMMRRNPKYGDDMKKRAAEFMSTLSAMDIPPAAKDEISQKLSAYQRDFSAWAEEAKSIERRHQTTSAEYATIDPAIEAVKSAVDKIRSGAEAAAAKTQAETTLVMQVSIIAIIFGVALLAFFIGRAISKPLSGMTGVMHKLASGDNSIEVPSLDRGDEIGQMAKAVLSFKEAAIERLRLEDEAVEQRKVARDERMRNEDARNSAAEELAKIVSQVAEGLGKLSHGDLTFRVAAVFPPAYQQLKDDFNAAMGQLQETMVTIVRAADEMRSGTTEFTQATEDLSRRTEQQAASLEETAAAVDEITATVRKTADGANHAKTVVSKAKGDAEHGGDVVRRAVEAMAVIEGSAKKISQIIGVIDEIAFQTNLLALNAGVEAARAGDAGRGFAVVASEVRSLAQRSAEAAKEIKGLISASSAQV
ncbi:MAG: HAMP domain-containing protein, partial [Rhizobiales bacterium]|nr:HAMP domain-containing protein [Hyphomicrobiales bacterium]